MATRKRDAIGKLMEAGQGFDVPPFEKLNDFGIWQQPNRLRALCTISRAGADRRADVFARHQVQDDRQPSILCFDHQSG
jgi:hypothetical protein